VEFLNRNPAMALDRNWKLRQYLLQFMRYLTTAIGIGIVIAAVVLIVVAQPKTAAKEYVQSIESHRAEIDRFMRQSGDSPIPEDQLAGFEGLKYYPVDAAYKVEARLERFEDPETIEVPTSADTFDPYARFGMLRFRIGDDELSFEAWKPLGGRVTNRLFVAFTDLTNGDETYGGGRYLNLYFDRDNIVTIDFNLAYNPYCVYDPTYICPVAPPENRLPVAIEAGEKSWK